MLWVHPRCMWAQDLSESIDIRQEFTYASSFMLAFRSSYNILDVKHLPINTMGVPSSLMNPYVWDRGSILIVAVASSDSL